MSSRRIRWVEVGDLCAPGKLFQHASHQKQACNVDGRHQVLTAQIDKPVRGCVDRGAVDLASRWRDAAPQDRSESSGRRHDTDGQRPGERPAVRESIARWNCCTSGCSNGA